MDLYVDIKNITFPYVEIHARGNVQHNFSLMVKEETFSDEENFVLQNSFFERESEKLVFERIVKSKSGKLRSTIDTQNMFPYRL